ncbi:MAG: T9SS type A sorting domain-containing protein, partial [Ginsengibacter sp.]
LALSTNGVAGSNGFPLIPSKVALVDGSLNGSVQLNSAACREVLNSKSFLKVNLFLFKVQLFRIAQASIYFAGNYNNACTVLSASQLFKSSVSAKGSAPAVSVSYDIAPGSLRTSFTTLADAGKGYSEFFRFLFELGSNTEFNVYNGSHSFVPTKSALAFHGINEDLAESVYDRNLVCTSETPFNTYYGSPNNLEHVFIDSAMANFAIAEITGKHRKPSYIASLPSAYISGPNVFCDSGGIYSLQGGSISPGTSLRWSVSPAIASISSGKDSTQIQLSKVSNGIATLNLQLKNSCGLNQTLTKTLSISGYSSSDYPVSGPPSACNNQFVYFSTSALPGATNYNWSWPADWTYIAGQGTYGLLLRTGNSSGNVSVRAASACDSGGSPAIQYILINNCSFVMNAAPNPIINDVTITTGQTQSLRSGITIADKIYKLEVIDILGNIKKKFSYSSGETNIKLNLGSLINGAYIIRVYNGKVWANKKIAIVH